MAVLRSFKSGFYGVLKVANLRSLKKVTIVRSFKSSDVIVNLVA